MKKLSSVSIFFPFWNEEENIEQVVVAAATIAPTIAEKWEILMIDDGSTDSTLQKATALSKDKHFRVISHNPNRGYGAALREGFANATYEYVVFTDGDGQFDFAEVEKFVQVIESADIVIGFRKKRRDYNRGKRLLLMNLLKIWDLIFFGFYFRDIDCGFKMFRKDALEKIMPLRSEGAMVTTEIMAKARVKKLKIKQVGVEHYPRKAGAQSGANAEVIIRAIIESVVLWWDIRNGRF